MWRSRTALAALWEWCANDRRVDLPRSSRLRHDLRASVIDGTAYMVMLGLAETFFAVFVLELKLGEVAAGLILTIPLLLASVMQLGTPWLVRRVGSHRRVVFLSAAFQVVALLPLIAIALVGHAPAWLVFVCATVYWAGAIVGGPAWSAWMGRMVPPPLRSRFFAYRNRWLQVGVLCGLLLGGSILRASNLLDAWLAHDEHAGHVLAGQDWTLPAFGMLFALAALARSVSTYYLWLQSEGTREAVTETPVSGIELLARARHGNDARLILSLLGVFFARQLAEPFWHPFVKEQLGNTYDRYVLLLAAGFVGKMLTLPILQRFVGRIGPLTLLRRAAVAMVPVTGLWVLHDSLLWLVVAQLLAGAALAAWELSSFLMLYETISPEERTSVISKHTFMQYLAGAGGSMAGGAALAGLGKDLHAYVCLFLGTMVVRLGMLALVARVRLGATSSPIQRGPLVVLGEAGTGAGVPATPEQAVTIESPAGGTRISREQR